MLALSGNQCSFPNCTHPILNEKHKLVAQLCHIEAAEKGGERFNENSNDEERRGYDNLLFLCYRHHVETDDTFEYTVPIMKEMKSNHEARFMGKEISISDEVMYAMNDDIIAYWKSVEYSHKYDNTLPEDIKFNIDFDASLQDLIKNYYKLIKFVTDAFDRLKYSDEQLSDDLYELFKRLNIEIEPLNKLSYVDNPFIDRNWEFHNIGNPNIYRKLNYLMMQIEIKVLELLKTVNGNDVLIDEQLEIKRKQFIEIVKDASVVD